MVKKQTGKTTTTSAEKYTVLHLDSVYTKRGLWPAP